MSTNNLSTRPGFSFESFCVASQTPPLNTLLYEIASTNINYLNWKVFSVKGYFGQTNRWSHIPEAACVYLIINQTNQQIIYVGQTINLKRRLSRHHIINLLETVLEKSGIAIWAFFLNSDLEPTFRKKILLALEAIFYLKTIPCLTPVSGIHWRKLPKDTLKLFGLTLASTPLFKQLKMDGIDFSSRSMRERFLKRLKEEYAPLNAP